MRSAPFSSLLEGSRGGGSTLRTIGAAFDGSPESRAATELARDLAAAVGASLKVIRVLPPTPPGGPALGCHPDWAERAEERCDSAARRPGSCARRRARFSC